MANAETFILNLKKKHIYTYILPYFYIKIKQTICPSNLTHTSIKEYRVDIKRASY